MIRSTDKRISVTDKLKFLWCLCTIKHCQEIQQPIQHYLIHNFGWDGLRMFNVYCEIAISTQFLAPGSYKLTPKAEQVVANWRQYQERIIDI